MTKTKIKPERVEDNISLLINFVPYFKNTLPPFRVDVSL
jgi:hypothetical protein